MQKITYTKNSKSRDDQLQFDNIENEITSFTRKYKQDYYRKYFDKHSKNLKNWNGIKEIINLKQKSSSLRTSLIDNGKIVSNQRDVANHFNFYFSDIAGKICKIKSIKESIQCSQDYLRLALPNSEVDLDLNHFDDQDLRFRN